MDKTGAAGPSQFARAEFDATQDSLPRYRELTADLCDVKVLGSPDAFRVKSSIFNMGAAVLLDADASALAYSRSNGHVARGGIDHFQLTMPLAGEMEYTAGRRAVTVRPGDILVLDMVEANHTRILPPGDGELSRALTFMLPRPLLAPLLAAPDSAQGSVISRETAYGGLMRDQLLAVRRYAPQLTLAESRGAVAAVAELVAAAIGRAPGAEETAARAVGQAVLVSIKAYIERHLTSELLSVDHLCRRFGLSRAALYREFEREGGAVGYIQRRRLLRAFRMLIAPDSRPRIIDIALESGFSTDATFIRAFRQLFGLTPGEVRAFARRRRQDGDRVPGDSSWPPASDADVIRWLKRLGATSRVPV